MTNIKKYIILLIMVLFNILFGTKPQQSETIKILPAEEFKEAIQDTSVQLIDVRTPQEFKEAAINNAQNIDFFRKKNLSRLSIN